MVSLDPDFISSVDPYPHPDLGGQKGPTKIETKIYKFHVFKNRYWIFSFLRSEGFSFNLDFLYGGLGIGKLLFWIKTI
jgi:hypothetical protein